MWPKYGVGQPIHVARLFSGPSSPRTILVQACQHLWLVLPNDGCSGSHFVDHAAQPSPRTPSMLGVLVPVSRPSLRRHGRGYIVPAASHRAVASAACAGRLPVMEHRVLFFSLPPFIEQSLKRLHVAPRRVSI